MIRIFKILILFFMFTGNLHSNTNEKLYKKIDLFGEVLEKIKKEYVEDVDQSEMLDSAINGALQSLDPYSAYMNPELFKSMETDTRGEFGGLGIEVGMEAGVVKVISPIDDTPASRAGIKSGDYIVKIDDKQVQGKSLMEAVKMMRGPIDSKIKLTIRRKGEKKALENLVSKLKQLDQSLKPEEIQTQVYTVGKENGYEKNLREWFKLIYEVVFGEENGPRTVSYTHLTLPTNREV